MEPKDSMETAAFLEAKEFLRGVPGGGISLYDHLVQVLVKILEERPADANALFEEISSLVRDGTITEAKPPPTEDQLVSPHRGFNIHVVLSSLQSFPERPLSSHLPTSLG